VENCRESSKNIIEALGLSKLATIFKDKIQKTKKKDKKKVNDDDDEDYVHDHEGNLDQILQVKITSTTNMMSLLL